MDRKIGVMKNVREYGEGFDVELWVCNDRLVVRAFNEGSHNATNVDLLDVLEWADQKLGVALRDGKI